MSDTISKITASWEPTIIVEVQCDPAVELNKFVWRAGVEGFGWGAGVWCGRGETREELGTGFTA
jgi:hypothetical protein